VNRIRVSRDAPLGRITLARPEKKNALDRQTADELAHALDELANESEVRVIVLDADGADFCAGADLEALAGMLDAGRDAHRDDARALGAVFLALRRLPVPVIAAVRGRALAGGAGLATACDLVVAEEGAQFGYPEVRVGFVPAMVMTLLRRCVGEKRAFELVATGRIVTASEALSLGLVSRVVSAADLDADVRALALQLGGTSPHALRLTKRLFYDLDSTSVREGIERGVEVNAQARDSADFREGVGRFVGRSRERA
jgi:methylglutaconyl-CoA hydratase